MKRFLLALLLFLSPLAADAGLKYGCGVLHGQAVKATSCNNPVYQLNFIPSGTPSLDPSITFTRSGATASDYNSSGALITGIAANTPRFDYNPSTLALNGLLLEPPSTNLSIQSSFASPWGSLSGVVVTPNVIASNYGTAATLIQDSTNSIHRGFSGSNITVVASTVYTFSVDVKNAGQRYFYFNAGSAIRAQVCFDLQLGTVVSTAQGTGAIQALAGGWYRVSVTGTALSSTSTAFVLLQLNTSASAADQTYTGDGVTGVDVDNFQAEAAPSATSNIATTTSTVTRGVDSAISTSIPWFNSSQGTFLLEAMVPAINTSRNTTIASFNDGTANNQIKIILNASGVPEAQVIVGGTASTSGGSLAAVTPGTAFKAALSFGSGGNQFSVNGAADTGGTFGAASVPSGITQLTLGNDGAAAQALDGWEQLFKDWNVPFQSAQLNAITR